MNNFKVVKFGSELIAGRDGINSELIEFYARGLSRHNADGLVVITSGAVAAGAARLVKSRKDLSGYKDATLAQLGCASVMRAWEIAFDKVGLAAGGLLVTHNELDSKNGEKFIDNIKSAANRGVISIINENDALSNRELMELACGGDNDGLAGHVARAINAKSLVLFTQNGGIYDNDAELIKLVDESNRLDIQNMLSARSNEQKNRGIGRGGIIKKFMAADESAKFGVVTKIAAVNADMTGDKVTEFMIG